ncbi:uncharacterized protein TNIN_197861 [Trichonephila inaurata madagascariensis]|uniref:Gustatory receptor n=1 Tax=Trichonephila inaurata madagascariensis TaxID=2747483 RepID=A0A8X6MGY0_9ARAC|nr:uncharacterized protein TNIN_197861 [Trichonephila inaurata madagascariensis]
MSCRMPTMVITISASISVLVPFMNWLITLIDHEDICLELIQYYTFRMVQYSSCAELHPIIMMYNFFHLGSLTAFLALYLVLCYVSRIVLRKHSFLRPRRMMASEVNFHKNRIELYFNRYRNITKVLRLIEQELSLPIFLSQINDLIGIHACLVRFASFDPKYELRHRESAIFMAVRAVLSFLCASVVAASVHEADAVAKEVNEELWQNVLASGMMVKNEKAISMLVGINTPFAFTAWGCFRFTKSYILSATGCLLTYSLLISQIYLSLK